MMMSRTFSMAIRPVALASALLAAGVSHAFKIDTTLVQAKGSSALNGSAATTLVDTKTNPTGSVDVIGFPTDGGSYAVMHSYGSNTGSFGSGSWGGGLYDVTGSFVIKQTITNDSAVAQSASFNFYITPGWLSTSTLSATGTFLEASIGFNVQVGGTSVWDSAGKVRTTASGSTTTFTGDTSLYNNSSGDGRSFSVGGSSKSVNLGVINAGASIELTYEMFSAASGNDLGQERFVPGYTYTVPEQTVQYYEGNGYDANGYPCGNEGPFLAFAAVEGGQEGLPIGGQFGCGNLITQTVPAHDVVVPGQTIFGTPGESTARSGDPFTIDPLTGMPVNGFQIFAAPSLANVAGVTAAIPEPSTYALMIAGLGLVGWAARRRKAISQV